MTEKSRIQRVGVARTLSPWKTYMVHSPQEEVCALTTLTPLTHELVCRAAPAPLGRATFVILTPSDLGFTYNPRTFELVSSEYLRGWSAERHLSGIVTPCAQGDVIVLRRRYFDQPVGERLYLAMPPIRAKNGKLYTLGLSHNARTGIEIVERSANPENEWRLSLWCIFRYVEPGYAGR